MKETSRKISQKWRKKYLKNQEFKKYGNHEIKQKSKKSQWVKISMWILSVTNHFCENFLHGQMTWKVTSSWHQWTNRPPDWYLIFDTIPHLAEENRGTGRGWHGIVVSSTLLRVTPPSPCPQASQRKSVSLQQNKVCYVTFLRFARLLWQFLNDQLWNHQERPLTGLSRHYSWIPRGAGGIFLLFHGFWGNQ